MQLSYFIRYWWVWCMFSAISFVEVLLFLFTFWRSGVLLSCWLENQSLWIWIVCGLDHSNILMITGSCILYEIYCLERQTFSLLGIKSMSTHSSAKTLPILYVLHGFGSSRMIKMSVMFSTANTIFFHHCAYTLDRSFMNLDIYYFPWLMTRISTSC